ncbi:MAG: caspase family protein [Acidobacteriia bacterium]|nr:caspase family protein [Terriglobia bacterium]
MVVETAAPSRRALIIGNANYAGSVPLQNTINDARAVTNTLGDLGFQVQSGENLDGIALDRAINTFVEGINAGDVALFYYSGHGMELSRENYLIPVDFRARDEAEAKHQSYSASLLLERLEARKPWLTIIILDACRNNPFRGARGGGGLAAMDAGAGVYVAFSTAPGRTASDNPGGKNGLFTGHLIEALAKPGLTLHDVFDEVGTKVVADSGGSQIPWSTNTPIGRFVFRDIAEQLKKAEADRVRIQLDIAQAQHEVDRLNQLDEQSRVAKNRDEALQAEARLHSLRLEEERKRADIKRWEQLDRERRKIEDFAKEQDAIERMRRDGEVRQLADLRSRVVALRSSVNTTSRQPETVDAAFAEWRSINAQILGIEAESRQMCEKAVADAESAYKELLSQLALSKPTRDTFETSREFQNRLTKYEEHMKEVETRRPDIASVHKTYETEMGKTVEPYKVRLAVIEGAYYPIKDRSALVWRYYDPDHSALWMTLGGTLLICAVFPADARIANASMDLLWMESRVRFSHSATEPYDYLVGHPAFLRRGACATNDDVITFLTGLLEKNELMAFRQLVDFALKIGTEFVFKIQLGFYPSSRLGPFSQGVGVTVALVTVSKTAVSLAVPFSSNFEFTVSPDKILELDDQLLQATRIHLKVAVKNTKGHKEDKKDVYLLNPGADSTSRLEDGKYVYFVDCKGCDDSMKVLFALLESVRGTGWRN